MICGWCNFIKLKYQKMSQKKLFNEAAVAKRLLPQIGQSWNGITGNLMMPGSTEFMIPI